MFTEPDVDLIGSIYIGTFSQSDMDEMCFVFFFFNDPATTEIYTYWHTLSLHDALPIYPDWQTVSSVRQFHAVDDALVQFRVDRKSTRLNSSHSGEPRMPSSA